MSVDIEYLRGVGCSHASLWHNEAPKLLTTRVLTASTVELEGWADEILALDRENMFPILEEAHLQFPEEKRRKGLGDPSTVLVLLLDDGNLAGYIEFCKDWNHDEDVYLGSIQVRQRYRKGWALAILISECAKELRSHSFAHLHSHVQTNNLTALALCRKLGFRVIGRAEGGESFQIIGTRDLLDSNLLYRLERTVGGKYRRVGAEG